MNSENPVFDEKEEELKGPPIDIDPDMMLSKDSDSSTLSEKSDPEPEVQ